MNINQITKDHIIVGKINRDFPILLCRHKTTADYAFFKICDNQTYEPLDKQLEADLRKVYNANPPKKFDLAYTVLDTVKVMADVPAIRKLCKECIELYLQDFPAKTREQCIAKFDSVKIEVKLEDTNSGACYTPHNNTITINQRFVNIYDFAYTLTHEFFHAITRNANDTSVCGSTKHIITQSPTTGVYTRFTVGIGLNEAITDYMAVEAIKRYIAKNKIHNNQANEFYYRKGASAYDFMVNNLLMVFSSVNLNLLLDYHLRHDFDGLMEQFTNALHYSDHDHILSWIYKMDAITASLALHPDSMTFMDRIALTQALYLNSMELVLHKYSLEGKDIQSLSLIDILPNKRFPLDGDIGQEFFLGLYGLYQYAQTQPINAYVHQNIYTDCGNRAAFFEALALKQNVNFPDEFLTADFILRTFSINIASRDKNGERLEPDRDRKAFAFLFSKDCTAFSSRQQKIDVIREIILLADQLPFKYLRCIPPSYIAEISNENVKFAEEIAKQDLQAFLNCKTLLKPETLISQNILESIAETCIDLAKRDKDYDPILDAFEQCFAQPEVGQMAVDGIYDIIENMLKAQRPTPNDDKTQ